MGQTLPYTKVIFSYHVYLIDALDNTLQIESKEKFVYKDMVMIIHTVHHYMQSYCP